MIAEPQYEMLQPAEVENLVALALRVAIPRPDLTCVHCKNRRRKELCFQGGPEIREHYMEGHGTMAPRSGEPEETVAAAAVPQEVLEAFAEEDAKKNN